MVTIKNDTVEKSERFTISGCGGAKGDVFQLIRTFHHIRWSLGECISTKRPSYIPLISLLILSGFSALCNSDDRVTTVLYEITAWFLKDCMEEESTGTFL